MVCDDRLATSSLAAAAGLTCEDPPLPPPAAAAAPAWPLAERRCAADGDPLLAFLAPPPVAAAAAPPSDLGEVCELLDAELRELCAAGALWPAGGAPLGPKAVAAAEAALYDLSLIHI